jgi:hypothetical protein
MNGMTRRELQDLVQDGVFAYGAEPRPLRSEDIVIELRRRGYRIERYQVQRHFRKLYGLDDEHYKRVVMSPEMVDALAIEIDDNKDFWGPEIWAARSLGLPISEYIRAVERAEEIRRAGNSARISIDCRPDGNSISVLRISE